MLATLLTWMAEKDTPVFVMATANAIDQLPPELLRKGRFDEIFVLDLPDGSERREILELHLRKRRPQHQLPLDTLVDRTSGFSGAELEQVVLEGMLNAFSEGREFGEADLISAAADLVPSAARPRATGSAAAMGQRAAPARPAEIALRKVISREVTNPAACQGQLETSPYGRQRPMPGACNTPAVATNHPAAGLCRPGRWGDHHRGCGPRPKPTHRSGHHRVLRRGCGDGGPGSLKAGTSEPRALQQRTG